MSDFTCGCRGIAAALPWRATAVGALNIPRRGDTDEGIMTLREQTRVERVIVADWEQAPLELLKCR
eukprot:scaffold122947_cov44-Tisochrysis_lutea.AAC.1